MKPMSVENFWVARELHWGMWETIKHQFFDFTALFGLRDRLRCPKCRAVGTWKPHGGWIERWTPSHIEMLSKLPSYTKRAYDRRWLCKYCGYNLNFIGEFQCYPNSHTK